MIAATTMMTNQTLPLTGRSPSPGMVQRKHFKIRQELAIAGLLAVVLLLSGQMFQWSFCLGTWGGAGDGGGGRGSQLDSVEGGAPTTAITAGTTTAAKTFVAIPASTSSSSSSATPLDCNFYLAESAIPRGGLGVFTTRSIAKGQPAQPFPDVCLYVTNAHSKYGTEIKTHTWQDYRFGAQWLGGDRVRGQCMGLVTIFNSMGIQEFSSARPAADKTLIHTHGGLDRTKDPGAGAISQFYGVTSVTRRDVQPGDELMLWDNGFGGEDYHQLGYMGIHNQERRNKDDSNETTVRPFRSPEWLQRHGMCMDHLKIAPATDPAMGRGAFANRRLPKGTVVAPAPLQIFFNRSHFLAPTSKEDNDDDYPYPEEVLVNYCFQPRGSSMLLFPYGAGVGMINHSRDQSKVNIRLQWSSHPLAHSSWLDEEMSLRQFQKMQYPGSLVLEYVATRDIAEDEEVFLDYGAEWDEAWKAHVAQWTPDAKATAEYVYPTDMDYTLPFRTIDEQEKKPYPRNLRMVCDSMNAKNKNFDNYVERVEWIRASKFWPESLVGCHILKRRNIKDDNGTDEEKDTLNHSPYLYEVEWVYRKNGERFKMVEINVPHSAIRFVDRPWHSDQHLSNGFRHPMGFPPEMTPSTWLTGSQ